MIDLFAKLYGCDSQRSVSSAGLWHSTIQLQRASKPVKTARKSNFGNRDGAGRNQAARLEWEVVSRQEFDALSQKVERLSMIVWSLLFENGETDVLFDEQTDYELKTFVSG